MHTKEPHTRVRFSWRAQWHYRWRASRQCSKTMRFRMSDLLQTDRMALLFPALPTTQLLNRLTRIHQSSLTPGYVDDFENNELLRTLRLIGLLNRFIDTNGYSVQETRLNWGFFTILYTNQARMALQKTMDRSHNLCLFNLRFRTNIQHG